MERLALLAKLHIAKKELGLDDETYRDALENLFKMRSARDLDNFQLGTAIAHFRRLGWKSKQKAVGSKQKKYDDQVGDAYSATPPQKRMIEAMWHEIYRGNDEVKHLRKFLFRVAKVGDMRFLERKGAHDVIEALKKMQQRRTQAPPINEGATGGKDAKAKTEHTKKDMSVVS